jgi:hypothetical protein
MKANISTLANRPAQLIAFVTSNRVNYKTLIFVIFEKYGNRPAADYPLKEFYTSFESAATNWISFIEKGRAIYWSRLLHCLLELQSMDDECLAICYTKMGDTKAAALLFNTNIYGDSALRFNPNACHRYLRYVYSQASVDERMKLELRYQKHFFVECDSFSGETSYEIRPIK